MVGLLVNAGMYDRALTICQLFEMKLTSVFDSLALRYSILSYLLIIYHLSLYWKLVIIHLGIKELNFGSICMSNPFRIFMSPYIFTSMQGWSTFFIYSLIMMHFSKHVILIFCYVNQKCPTWVLDLCVYISGVWTWPKVAVTPHLQTLPPWPVPGTG